jgi:hypothetical protein
MKTVINAGAMNSLRAIRMLFSQRINESNITASFSHDTRCSLHRCSERKSASEA